MIEKIPDSVSYRILYIFFFYKTNFYSVNGGFHRFWWHLDLETLGMPPGGFLALGKAFRAILMSFLRIL